VKIIESSLSSLEAYILKEKYIGYDPYDILTSYIPFKQLGKWPSAIATQIQKRNPVNIRPLLGVKKEINPKAFGLFLQSYSLLYQKTQNPEYLEKADYFFDWLNNNFSEGYSGKCWGYNFPWANPEKYMDAYIPSSVVTGFIIKGLFEYHKIANKKKEVRNLIESACRFLDNDLEKVEIF
jgi:type II restriction/modification system DNA methylase subunit YeeA